MKATQSEIKEKIQENSSEGKETWTQVNEQKEEINTQPEKNEETRTQKVKRVLQTSGTT